MKIAVLAFPSSISHLPRQPDDGVVREFIKLQQVGDPFELKNDVERNKFWFSYAYGALPFPLYLVFAIGMLLVLCFILQLNSFILG
jgi:hypothetical protein